mmetsp:Transcript_4108/g.8869  ORF Transcript_4108/g.8869 Transcript_4108/m.8869 type:complete len:212 (-) Transcript_4108:1052-1687(-)
MRTARASDSSASTSGSESTITAFAVCAETLRRSVIIKGLPLRQITLVPYKCSGVSALANAFSISSFWRSHKRTTTPPPSLSFAMASSRIVGITLSDQPSISVCPLSMTRLRPFFRSSRRSDTLSAMIPIIKAKISMPPIVKRRATRRSARPRSSACVPGSATKVHAIHTDSEYVTSEPELSPQYSVAPDIIRRYVASKRATGFALDQVLSR